MNFGEMQDVIRVGLVRELARGAEVANEAGVQLIRAVAFQESVWPAMLLRVATDEAIRCHCPMHASLAIQMAGLLLDAPVVECKSVEANEKPVVFKALAEAAIRAVIEDVHKRAQEDAPSFVGLLDALRSAGAGVTFVAEDDITGADGKPDPSKLN